MDSLQAYGSSSEEEEEEKTEEATSKYVHSADVNENKPLNQTDESFRPVATVQRTNRSVVNAAPAISITAKVLASQQQQQSSQASAAGGGVVVKKRKRNEEQQVILSNNPTKHVLYEPLQGPQRDAGSDSQRQLSRYAPQELRANVAVDEAAFHQQRHDFQKTGKALALTVGASSSGVVMPENTELVRTTLGYERQRLEKFSQQDETRQRVRDALERQTEKAPLVLGSDDEVEFGVWGPPSRQEQWQKQNQLTSAETGTLAPEQVAEREYIVERNRVRGQQEEDDKPAMTLDRILERKMSHLLPPQQTNDKPIEASTQFHGDAEYDYQGRSWMAPPPGLRSGADDQEPPKSYVPKKCVARFGASSNQTEKHKGVHRIRLFPRTGHLLLCANLDGTCQVWSVHEKKLLRTYSGHSAAVRDVQFNSTGTRFVSASFDRFLRLWDTESGKVLQDYSNSGKVPYCVQFYPRDDAYFVVGCSDNRIRTYHADTAEQTQEYNHHLAPVNAIVFVHGGGSDDDNNSKKNEPVRMVSSSDDKKILVWEWDIGVPIKYISDPTLHSMPCLSRLHPVSQQFFCGQSLDNTICCFQTTPKIKLLHKKKFSGHIVSGYACELDFSPDGRFLTSGDGTGALFVWDWKRHKVLQKFRAHEPGKPTSSVVWHPLEPSTVITCSWDGTIKVWQ